ncbi:MAG: hypothetical protein K2X81_03920, partial [Candidatus Obscuribacterales bacterium]|nr:hypothetical protein [Candidatus Obscuribacterales bacterium]
MGDHRQMDSTDKLSRKDDHKDASEALRLSLTKSDLISDPRGGVKSNTDKALESIAEYKVGRYGLVTAEGLALLPQGIGNGIKHNLDHPDEFAMKMGTAALMGVGMRVLLPEAGAARALVGTAMTYFMARDAVMPIIGAMSQVSDNKSMANINDAATKMSNGLGLFTVDMAAGLPIGIAADKLAGRALTGTSSGRSFEAYKESFYKSDSNPVGKFFNWSEKTADAASAAVSDKLLGKQGEQLSMEQKLRLIKDGGAADGQNMTIEQKLKLIQENMDHEHAAPRDLSPDAEAAFKAYLEHKRWHKNGMPSQIDELLGDNSPVAEGVVKTTVKPTEVLGAKQTLRALDSEGKPGEGGTEPTPMGDRAAAEVPKGPPPKPLTGDAKIVADMSVTVRDLAGLVTDTDMKIGNFKESVQSPLVQTMRTGKPPLDEGHWGNNEALVQLAGEIQTPEHIKQAGFLLEHHRVANIQMGLPEQMPEIVDLNQYSRSVHKNLMDLLRKEGINPENVLRGTNSPIFLIFDSNGSGPYTIPAIKGVTDTAVIVVPREYQQMLGVHVAGVYSHELGHDLIYGDLLRFPENLRDSVLRQDVVAAAMKSKGIADTPMEVPGHGTIPKSEFFTKLLLAEANENTADIFGTAIDPNTPLSLATLLGSLRKAAANAPEGAAGQLETRSMYGKEFVDAESNPLGIEPHGIDAWRIKLGAEVLRQLSNNDAKVSAYADKLDTLSENLRRPGDNYVWANMDDKGKFVAVNKAEWDAIIPGIVKAQLETPLPALNNKMLRDVYPDMTKIFPRVDGLAEQMAAAARNGDKSVAAFDKNTHHIEDIYSAGLSGWMKALDGNPEAGKAGYIAPDVLLERINNLSREMTAQYRGDNFLPQAPKSPNKFDFNTLVFKPAGFVGRGLGEIARAEPKMRDMFSKWEPKASIYGGV